MPPAGFIFPELGPDVVLKVVADFVQEESWGERNEILLPGLSEMMREKLPEANN